MTPTEFRTLVLIFLVASVCLVAGLGGITETMVVRPDLSAWEIPTMRICLAVGVLFQVILLATFLRRIYQLELDVKQLKALAAEKKGPV